MSTVPQIDENSDNKPEMNGDDDNLVDAKYLMSSIKILIME